MSITGKRPNQPALIYDSPMTGEKRSFTYAELLDDVSAFAAVLRDKGVRKGDRVIIYMPMIPQAVIGMLACARIGAIHSVVFGGFAANELATRINDAKPKLILAASCGLEPGRIIKYKPLLDAALAQASHKPDGCIIFQRADERALLTPGRDHDWTALFNEAKARGNRADCGHPFRHRPALHPLHLRHHRRAERRRARQWRAHGGAEMDDAEPLRHSARRRVLDGVRRRLGGRPLLYRLRAAPAGRDHDPL